MDPVQESQKAQESLPAPSLSFLTCGIGACLLHLGMIGGPFALQTVGESLLYMLEKCLGPAFTPATGCLEPAYGAVVQAMSRGWGGEASCCPVLHLATLRPRPRLSVSVCWPVSIVAQAP